MSTLFSVLLIVLLVGALAILALVVFILTLKLPEDDEDEPQ